MEVNIYPGEEFKRQLKRLAKKYRSLKSDLQTFSEDLKKNPFLGTDLGSGVRKVRLEIKSKGKSGGARILTFKEVSEGDSIDIMLLTIYDKSEIENVSDNYIKALVSQFKK